MRRGGAQFPHFHRFADFAQLGGKSAAHALDALEIPDILADGLESSGRVRGCQASVSRKIASEVSYEYRIKIFRASREAAIVCVAV